MQGWSAITCLAQISNLDQHTRRARRTRDPPFSALKRGLKPLRNRACDLVLDREHIFHLTIVAPRSQKISVRAIHQLCHDAQTVVSSAHTCVERGAHVQLLSDGVQVDVFGLEQKSRTSGYAAEDLELRENPALRS